MATWNKTDTETKEEIAQQEQKDKCECSNKIEKLEHFLNNSLDINNWLLKGG